MRRSIRLIRLAGPLLLLVAGCALNPVTGRPEMVLVSQAKERELGEAEAKRVAETIGLVDDAALTAYVGSVGERLARFSPLDVPYTFQVVDMEEPNAFALPGGYVYVSRGILALMNTEDELAGVLGHEVGHVAARHAVRRVSQAAPLAVVTGVTAAVTGIVSPTLGGLVGGVGNAANALILAPYSREQEREADRIGQDLAAQAGWDPAGLSRSLQALERDEALEGEGERAMSFFATHPPLPRRVAETEEHAKTLQRGPAAPIAGTRTEFLYRLDGLPIGPRPADGVFQGEMFLHPDLDFHLRFPTGWKTVNARTLVGASAPDGRAVVGLEVAGSGNDPATAMRALEQEAKVDLASHAERLTIGDLPAMHATARARTRDGVVVLDLTWIALGGRIYRITGATPVAGAEALRPVFRDTAASLGPLTATERASIRETRLRLVQARAGESLEALLTRAHGKWSAEMAAVANGLDATTPLQEGQLIKVPVERPYRPKIDAPS
ncbi:MAG TPA: M48 family metalloprotease [Candidatus Binatus sp.]|nr:M48 family metalloprotease [Candidatus Binatus sp.]